MDYKDIIEQLTDSDVIEILRNLGGDIKRINGDSLIFPTICHNDNGNGTPKLYYYKNTKVFFCYTECNTIGNIFNLVMKVKDCSFGEAISFVCNIVGIKNNAKLIGFGKSKDDVRDFEILDKYKRKSTYELKGINTYVLDCFRDYYTNEWLSDGICEDTHRKFGIKYNVLQDQIVIPHRDFWGNLVGIRVRNLDKIMVSNGQKYMPLIYNNTMYNHSIRHNIFGLYAIKDTVKKRGKIVLVESEKGCLQGDTMFLDDNYIASLCGSNLSKQQRDLIVKSGAKEVILALDKQYKKIGDLEFLAWKKKIYKMVSLLIQYVDVSIIWDEMDMLEYKDSPTDKGKEVFLKLYENRTRLSENELLI